MTTKAAMAAMGEIGMLQDRLRAVVRERDDALARERGCVAVLQKELDAARKSLENVRMLAARAKVRAEPLLRGEEVDHLLRFCGEAGIVGSVLRTDHECGKQPGECEATCR